MRDKHTVFWLALPSGLAFSRSGARLAALLAAKQGRPLPPGLVERLFAELRRMHKKYPGMELVEVKAADGAAVRLRL